MFRNTNVRNLWTDRRGSVAVEFTVISVFLLIFMVFLADLVIKQAMVGKLDRISYSIAGVVRERIQLYHSDETVVLEQVGDIHKLAARMLKDMDPSANTSKFTVRVEQVSFMPRTDLTNDTKYPKIGTHFIVGNDDGCFPVKELSEQIDLSPRGSYGRWVPLYQVTVCVPLPSWYSRFAKLANASPLIRSSSIVMAR